MRLYFAYGRNLNLVHMKRRCADAVVQGAGRLEGYGLAFRPGATIVPVPDARAAVAGCLWSISAEDERRLDGFENFPARYRKERVEVATRDGPRVAMAYVINLEAPAPPSAEYFTAILEAYAQWGFDRMPLHRAWAVAGATFDPHRP